MIRAFEFIFTLLQLGPILTLTIGSNPLSPHWRPDLARYERRNRKTQLYRRESGNTSPHNSFIDRSTEETYQ